MVGQLGQQQVAAALVDQPALAQVGGEVAGADEVGGHRLQQLVAVAIDRGPGPTEGLHQRPGQHQVGEAQRAEQHLLKVPT